MSGSASYDLKYFTLSLNSAISSSVMVSALAITGIKLTLVWSLRMNSMSICFNLYKSIVEVVWRRRFAWQLTSGQLVV